MDVIRNGIEHDIDVDAATGKVTRHRTDDDRAHSTRSNDDTRGHGSDDSRGRGGDDHRGHGSDDKHDDDSRGRGHGSDD
ncbi:hypothetical protein J3R03_006334 [Actinoplanes couchii]|nr:hypothetical protein [Actinoplanes couchii]